MTAPKHRADHGRPSTTPRDYVPKHRRERGPVGHHTADGWTWVEVDRV